MKFKCLLLIASLVSSNAFALCGSYYSTAEKAGERMNELLKIDQGLAGQAEQKGEVYQRSQVRIIVTPKNVLAPCQDGVDQFRIEIKGAIQNEGDVGSTSVGLSN
jgi:hypothetical protein